MANTKRTPIETRLWSRIKIGEPSECWPWQGCVNNMGYGLIGSGGRHKQGNGQLLAHRVAYELKNGPIPKGLFALHSCDNPPCCNPGHLRAGTRSDNTKDSVSRGRHQSFIANRSGETNLNHKLSKKDVLEIRSSSEKNVILATRFGVNRKTIYRIKNKEQWQNLT